MKWIFSTSLRARNITSLLSTSSLPGSQILVHYGHDLSGRALSTANICALDVTRQRKIMRSSGASYVPEMSALSNEHDQADVLNSAPKSIPPPCPPLRALTLGRPQYSSSIWRI